MINFSEGHHEYGSQEELKQMINEIIDELGAYTEGSTHGGLSPSSIQDIISYVLYQENNTSVTFKINKDIDDYHLSLEVINKQS